MGDHACIGEIPCCVRVTCGLYVGFSKEVGMEVGNILARILPSRSRVFGDGPNHTEEIELIHTTKLELY